MCHYWWVVRPQYMRVHQAFHLILFVSCWDILGAVQASYHSRTNYTLWSRAQPLQHDIWQYCENDFLGINFYLWSIVVVSTPWLIAAHGAGPGAVSKSL